MLLIVLVQYQILSKSCFEMRVQCPSIQKRNSRQCCHSIRLVYLPLHSHCSICYPYTFCRVLLIGTCQKVLWYFPSGQYHAFGSYARAGRIFPPSRICCTWDSLIHYMPASKTKSASTQARHAKRDMQHLCTLEMSSSVGMKLRWYFMMISRCEAYLVSGAPCSAFSWMSKPCARPMVCFCFRVSTALSESSTWPRLHCSTIFQRVWTNYLKLICMHVATYVC